MLKKELRAYYKNKRLTLSQDEVFLFSKQITERLLDFFPFEKGMRVHVFLPIEKLKEIQTSSLIKELWHRGVDVFVPRVVGDDIVSLPYTSDTALEVNYWGIHEPVISKNALAEPHFDVVVVPVLYVDKKGHRIGYGKGFYDRFFNIINKDAVKIGVNYFTPDENIDDADAWDVRLDYLVTPIEVVSFMG